MPPKHSTAAIEALEAMTMNNLLALDDAHLSQFSNLCLHWRELAEAERRRRLKAKL